MIGKVLLEFPVLGSTNDYALELLRKGTVVEGLVVSAAAQTHGKGQAGAKWESEPGVNIAMSVVLLPSFLQPVRHFSLNQAIALAVRDTLAPYLPVPVSIKWPNDIIAGNGKIAGILIQTQLQGNRFQHGVAGIGINVNQAEFPNHLPQATSLAKITGQSFNLRNLREVLCFQLDTRYAQLRAGNLEEISRHYTDHLFRAHISSRFRRVDGSVFEGTIEGVSEDGRLLVRKNQELEKFSPKEIAFDVFP